MTCSFPLGLNASVRSTVTVRNKLLMMVIIQVFGGGRGGVEEWSVGGWVEREDEQSWVGLVFYYNLVYILFIYKFLKKFISGKE